MLDTYRTTRLTTSDLTAFDYASSPGEAEQLVEETADRLRRCDCLRVVDATQHPDHPSELVFMLDQVVVYAHNVIDAEALLTHFERTHINRFK